MSDFSERYRPIPDPASLAEIQAAADILSRVPEGMLPLPLFTQIARLATLSTIEMVPLRDTDQGEEVLLIPRPESDKWWPGQLHVPGTVLLPTDTDGSFESAINRVRAKEIGTMTLGNPVHFTSRFQQTERGAEGAHIHYVEVLDGDPSAFGGAFHPVDELPDNVIDHHYSLVALATDAYRRDKSAR